MTWRTTDDETLGGAALLGRSRPPGRLWAAQGDRRAGPPTLLPAVLVLLVASAGAPQTKQPDLWEPLRFFIGAWEGTGKGQPGVSRLQREYQFTLNGKFIQVRNTSTYAPQEKNSKGERHEDWGMLSFDARRQQFVLRQFHVEGFVNQYVMEPPSDGGKTLVFESESIENFRAGWRARETYKLLTADEFVEVFELAGPGKQFEVYTENHFTRKR